MATQPLSSSAADSLAALVSTASPQAVERVTDALADRSLTLQSTAVGIGRLRGVDQRNAGFFARAFAQVRDTYDAEAVALALRTAHLATVLDAKQRPQAEVVWSGPEAGGPHVRPTTAVLSEMLQQTRNGGEVIVVGYSLTADDGSPSKEVIAWLAATSKRHAQVTVVLHKDKEESNRNNLLAAWDKFAVKPVIYTWQPEARGAPYRKLHAKVLVVDRVQVLVTSANLTYHGLAENLEIGLRVKGPQAAAIAQRFDHLIAHGVLQEWKD